MSDNILEMNNIVKCYGGVKALSDVNLKIKRAEVHALVGENGAGKSTLMNVLSGVIPYGEYSGDIIYNNEVCKFNGIHDSESKGIVIVHQELALIPELSIAENMFIGNEQRSRLGSINWDKTYSEAKNSMKRVCLDENPKTLIKDIGVGKQQLVEIAKALSKNVKLLILDEPTSSLNEQDSNILLNMIIGLKDEGITSIIITHKLPEVAYVSDRITVLRDGATIETIDNYNHDIKNEVIIPKMVGRELVDLYPKRNFKPTNEKIFEVKHWNVNHPIYTEKKIVKNVSFNVHKKEIVGFYGLQGAGCTELAMSLFGKAYGYNISGEEILNSKNLKLNNEKQAIDAGLAYVTEDRKTNGLLLEDSVVINTSLAKLSKVTGIFGIINKDIEQRIANDYVKTMKTKVSSVNQAVGSLSGGNQQKVLLSKWMLTEPQVLFLDEPTRGIDVGAKYEIYQIMNDMLEQNKGIVMFSSELPELIGMCDRIYVMHEGQVLGEFDVADVTQEKVMECIYNSEKR